MGMNASVGSASAGGHDFQAGIVAELIDFNFTVRKEVEVGDAVVDIFVTSATTACVVALKWNVTEVGLSTLAFLAQVRDDLGILEPDIPVRSVLAVKMKGGRTIPPEFTQMADSLGVRVAMVKDYVEAAESIAFEISRND